jgi:hypothetical protein
VAQQPTIVGQFIVGDGTLVGFTVVGVRTPSSVPSAAAFGVPIVQSGSLKLIAVAGLASAQSFGVFTTRVGRTVGGVSSAQAFGVPVPRNIVVVVGIPSAAQFGTPKFLLTVFVAGLASAGRLGVITYKTGPVFIPVLGVRSAAQVGRPSVFLVRLRPSICAPLTLVGDVCLTLDLVPAVSGSLDLEPAECA